MATSEVMKYSRVYSRMPFAADVGDSHSVESREQLIAIEYPSSLRAIATNSTRSLMSRPRFAKY